MRHASVFRAVAARFGRDRRGATAVETAFVIGPFFLIVAGIIEVGMIALGSSAMENAVRDVGRSTRVDTTQCLSPGEFKAQVCGAVAFLPNCSAAMEVQRRTFANFGSGGQNWNNSNPSQWDASQGGDITVYQARYVWKNMFPMLDHLLGTPQANGGNGVMISQSYAYKNEQWGSRNCGDSGGGAVLTDGNGVSQPDSYVTASTHMVTALGAVAGADDVSVAMPSPPNDNGGGGGGAGNGNSTNINNQTSSSSSTSQNSYTNQNNSNTQNNSTSQNSSAGQNSSTSSISTSNCGIFCRLWNFMTN